MLSLQVSAFVSFLYHKKTYFKTTRYTIVGCFSLKICPKLQEQFTLTIYECILQEKIINTIYKRKKCWLSVDENLLEI
jgi:hypothetical protein